MKFSSIIKRNISLTLLAFMVFSFLHSEIGFMDFDRSSHDAHDYCEIVKNTSTQIKVIREQLPKPEVRKDIFLNFKEPLTPNTPIGFLVKTSSNFPTGNSEKVYLSNSALLI